MHRHTPGISSEYMTILLELPVNIKSHSWNSQQKFHHTEGFPIDSSHVRGIPYEYIIILVEFPLKIQYNHTRGIHSEKYSHGHRIPSEYITKLVEFQVKMQPNAQLQPSGKE